MLKTWPWAKSEKRASEGDLDRWAKLESRVETIEVKLIEAHQKLDSVVELPLQWATTLTQLRRLVGHVTKSNALDQRSVTTAPPPVVVQSPLTQDDVLMKIHQAAPETR